MMIQTTYSGIQGLIFGKLGKEVRVNGAIIGYEVMVLDKNLNNDFMICSEKNIKKIKETV